MKNIFYKGSVLLMMKFEAPRERVKLKDRIKQLEEGLNSHERQNYSLGEVLSLESQPILQAKFVEGGGRVTEKVLPATYRDTTDFLPARGEVLARAQVFGETIKKTNPLQKSDSLPNQLAEAPKKNEFEKIEAELKSKPTAVVSPVSSVLPSKIPVIGQRSKSNLEKPDLGFQKSFSHRHKINYLGANTDQNPKVDCWHPNYYKNTKKTSCKLFKTVTLGSVSVPSSPVARRRNSESISGRIPVLTRR